VLAGTVSTTRVGERGAVMASKTARNGTIRPSIWRNAEELERNLINLAHTLRL
jgi:hypothetical protein